MRAQDGGFQDPRAVSVLIFVFIYLTALGLSCGLWGPVP